MDEWKEPFRSAKESLRCAKEAKKRATFALWFAASTLAVSVALGIYCIAIQTL